MAKKTSTQTALTNQKYAIYLIVALLILVCGVVIYIANMVQSTDRAYTTESNAFVGRVMPTSKIVKIQDNTCRLGSRVTSCQNTDITFNQTTYDGKTKCKGDDVYSASMVCCTAESQRDANGRHAMNVTIAAGQLTGGTCATREDLARAIAQKCGYTFVGMDKNNKPILSCK